MRRFIIAATVAATSIAAGAQSPMQCANPDIINGVLFAGHAEEKIEVAPGLPALMSGFRAPSGLSLIGTGVRGAGAMTNVAYKSALSTDKTFAAIVAALGADGWETEFTDDPGSTFNISGGRKSGVLCKDDERRTVVVWGVAGVSYANIVMVPQVDRRKCNDTGRGTGPFGLRVDLPRLQFPAGTILPRGPGGGGGSDRYYDSTTRVISTQTAAQLLELLGGQMQRQGWRPDADWSGAGSVGSTWRNTVGDQLAWSTLEITGVGKDTYDVGLSVAVQ